MAPVLFRDPMSYLVIARKWRPQSFEELVGQPHVTRTLGNAIRSNRIAHAYLFTGARGVGKTSVARILAKALNCETGITAVPCNVCSNCVEITRGNSVDVLEIDGASNRGIDNIRELRETVRYRPAKSRYKIYIIDEVHMLTTEAFNALLKTLEEPPEHVIFIFATTEPHKIPATILSRCQRFDFRRIPAGLLVDHLKAISEKEQANLSDPVLYAIAREADGSMRDAQSLLEQMLSFSREDLTDEQVLDVLGVIDRSTVQRAGKAVIEGDVRACLDVVDDLYRRGIDNRRFCRQLCDHFRNLLVISLGEGEAERRLDLPEEEKKLLGEEAKRTTPETLYLYFQTIMKGEEDIRRSTVPKIALEMLLLRMAQLPRLEALQGLIDKLSVLERAFREGKTPSGELRVPSGKARPLPAPAPSGEAPPPAENPGPAEARVPVPKEPDVEFDGDEERSEEVSPSVPAAPGEVTERWPSFVEWLGVKDPVLAAELMQSRVGSVSDDSLEVEVLEVFEGQLKDPQALAKISEAVQAFFGKARRLAVSKKPPAEGASGPQKARKSKAAGKRSVMEHPVVQQALEILGGELVDIRRPKTEKAGSRKETPPAEE